MMEEAMQEMAISQFNKTMLKAIGKYAKELKAPEEKIRINLELDDNGENVYVLCIAKEKVRDVTFKQIVGAKFVDFSGKDQYIPPFINKALKFLTDYLKLDQKISVKIIKTSDSDLRLCLFNGEIYKTDVTLEQVFSLMEN